MLNLPLLPVIQSWLEYLRLEDLANAEVDKGAGNYQTIFDKDVQVVGDKLCLGKALFDRLKQAYSRADKYGGSEDAQIALAFPTLYRPQGKGKDQRLKYYPLFTVDVTWILKGSHRQVGWSLLDCNFYPIAPNLIEFCGLEESEVDSLVVSEGILSFIKDVFRRSFPSLQDFLNQVDLPESCKTERAAYLIQATHLTGYNTRLKKDLRLIKQQVLEKDDDCTWLQEHHPARLYLQHNQQETRSDVLFWAAFPGKVPDEFQAQAIKQAQIQRLTAVSGGPGSGKTELLLHLLAQPLYERSLAIAQNEPDRSSLCLFASTNNSAIDKFRQRLQERLPGELFYLPGGNRRDVIPNQMLPKLRAAVDWLQSQTFDASQYEEAKQSFLQAQTALRKKIEEEPELHRQRATDIALLEQINADLMGRQSIPQEDLPDSEDSKFSDFPIEAYRQIKTALEQAQSELTEGGSPFKRLSDWMLFNTPKAVFTRLEQRIRPAWVNAQTTAFPFQLPISPNQLQIAIADVTEQLNQAEQWQAGQSLRQRRHANEAKTSRAIAALEERKQEVQARLESYPTEGIYARFYRQYHSLQVRIFESSWNLLQQESIRRKAEIQAALRLYEQILLGDEHAILELQLEPHKFYQNISLVFPVISSSLQSLGNLFPVLEPSVIRLALLDEAGATSIHQPFPLLVRSEQAVVVGDPQQLRPITNLCADSIESYRKSAFQAQNLDLSLYQRYAPTASSTATAYHRAAGAAGEDREDGILLANQYRSVPEIVAFCSPNYPNGLVAQIQSRPSLLGANFLAYHVAGQHEFQANPDEIKSVIEVITRLLKAGYGFGSSFDSKHQSIGIMSPFFHQATALRRELRSRWQIPWTDIGTVHSFQGGEKSVIVFSPYQCDRNHFGFLNRHSNLLNTAVSRTEELFILVGNIEELEAAGGETRRLVNHIRQFGEVRSLS